MIRHYGGGGGGGGDCLSAVRLSETCTYTYYYVLV